MISQPRYLPCISYLRRIEYVDTFIILDNVQRVERGFENRNKLLDMNSNQQWLTIPVKSSSRCLIKDAEINGEEWIEEHRRKVSNWYPKHPDIDEVFYEYTERFKRKSLSYRDGLVDSLEYISNFYGIGTEFVLASNISATINGGVDELIRLTKLVGGDTYVSGKTCLSYGLDHDYATEKGVNLEIDEVNGIEYGFIDSLYMDGVNLNL